MTPEVSRLQYLAIVGQGRSDSSGLQIVISVATQVFNAVVTSINLILQAWVPLLEQLHRFCQHFTFPAAWIIEVHVSRSHRQNPDANEPLHSKGFQRPLSPL